MAMGVPPAPFRFAPRRGKLQWRRLSSLDLDRVARETDLDALEAHLEELAFAQLTEGDLRWISEPGYLQLFRVMQMLVEYLLYVQNALHTRNVELETTAGTQAAAASPPLSFAHPEWREQERIAMRMAPTWRRG
jgi:hypothetical protein